MRIEELVRLGEFGHLQSDYANAPDVMAWRAALALPGLTSLGVARRRMHV